MGATGAFSFSLLSTFFGLSTFLAAVSLSTNSIIAIGASSPYLNPAFKTLEYPPSLLSYLAESTSKTLITELLSCNLENNLFLLLKLFFFLW